MIAVPSFKFRAAALGMLAALLTACGGGGGGGGGPAPTVDLAITTQNRDEVARASFAGAVSGAVGGFTGAASGGASPLVAKRAQAAALALRKRIAADVSADLCPGGGAADATETDTAPVGQVNPGDSALITFTNCADGVGTVANGQMRLTVSDVGTSSLSFAVAVSNLSVRDTATDYEASLNGGFMLTLSGSTGIFTTRLSVPDALEMFADVGTINDTITLLQGYVTEATYTAASATTSATAAGPVHSLSADGTFRVSTPQPLLQTDNEDYPHAGQVLATGVNSRMRATVLSNTQVRLELDADNDGAFDDGTTVVPWTELL